MFIYLLFALLPALAATECIHPGYPDGSQPDNRDVISYFEPESIFSAWCSTNQMSDLAPYKTCSENGSWRGEHPRCGKDVAKYLVWKTSNGTCTPEIEICNPATSWELSLEIVSYPAVNAFKIYYDRQEEEEINITSQLVLKTGELIEDRFFKSADRTILKYEFPSRNVAKVKITSTAPVRMLSLALFSFTGLPVYNKSAGYWYTYNQDTRIVRSPEGEKANFTEAKKSCASYGGRMLEPFDPETLKYLQRSAKQSPIWIGLSASENAWKWESGRLFDQQLFEKYPIAGKPKNGLAVSYDSFQQKLLAVDQTEKLHFACKLDFLQQDCMKPGVPAAGRILRTNNERTEYECFKGYKMIGEAVRKCDLTTGYYLSDLPECVKEN